MAVCKICGAQDDTLPQDWTNWECWECFNDLLDGVLGAFSREERDIIGLDHGSALPPPHDAGEYFSGIL